MKLFGIFTNGGAGALKKKKSKKPAIFTFEAVKTAGSFVIAMQYISTFRAVCSYVKLCSKQLGRDQMCLHVPEIDLPQSVLKCICTYTSVRTFKKRNICLSVHISST